MFGIPGFRTSYRLSCTSQPAWRRSTLSVETDRLRSRTPSDAAALETRVASPNVGQCGYQPAFSNGFTSRRTVFDAPLAWPPGWANNMPPCFISQLCCLGDRLVWVVGLPPERFVTRRLPSLRTASNADECQKQSRAARNASPAVWRILPAVRTKSHSSSA